MMTTSLPNPANITATRGRGNAAADEIDRDVDHARSDASKGKFGGTNERQSSTVQ